MSKTQDAIKLVESGMSAYASAKQVGISAGAVSRGLKRKAENSDSRCPCCNQVVKDKDVLKSIKKGIKP